MNIPFYKTRKQLKRTQNIYLFVGVKIPKNFVYLNTDLHKYN